MRTFIFALLAGLMMTGGANADIINIENIDVQDNRTFSGFTSTVGMDADIINLTGTADFDGGGLDDTLSFTITRSFFTVAATVNASGDVTLPAPNTTNGNLGNTNNFHSSLANGQTLGIEVSNIVYTSGEADGTTAVFNGFQALNRINFTSGTDPIDLLIHTGSVGSTTVRTVGTPNNSSFDLTSAGTSPQLFITSDPANNPANTTTTGNIRLRDLDLQFETVSAAIPEPTSFAVLLGGLSMMVMRRRRS